MIKSLKNNNVQLNWANDRQLSHKRIALLIPQYNEESNGSLFKRLAYFKSLSDKYKQLFDLILIDDGSTDSSLSEIVNFICENPGCFFLASIKPNANKVGAIYKVLVEIKHEYVILSDFDTDLEYLDEISNCLDEIDSNKEFMGCYFKMIPHEGKGCWFVLQKMEYCFARIYYKFHKEESSVPVMPGAGSCYKRENLLKVYESHSGLRNGEDREATILGLQLGFKTFYANKILALTRPPLTFRALIIQRRRWYLGYLETFFKEKQFYLNSIASLKKIGLRTLQDFLGIILLLFLPIEILVLALFNLKFTVFALFGIYFLSVFYYSSLFLLNPDEKTEFKFWDYLWIPVYPVLWLIVSFLSWWQAFMIFFNRTTREKSSNQILEGYSVETDLVKEESNI